MTSPFVSSLIKEHGSMNPKQYGENGAVEFSQHGVKGDGSRDVEGYLTAAFSGILRGTSQQSISKYINNIVNARDFTKQDFWIWLLWHFIVVSVMVTVKVNEMHFFTCFLKLQSIIRMRCLQFWILFQNMDVGKIIKK